MVVPAAVALVLVGGGLWRWQHSSGASATNAVVERTIPVTSGILRQTVSASGTLKPADTKDLNFSVSGKVTAVNVTAGQKVSTGDLLATVDSAALQGTVAQASAAVDSASAKLSTDQTNAASAAQRSADAANVAAAQATLSAAQESLAGASLVSPIDGTVSVVNLAVGQQLGSSGGSATSLVGSGSGSGQTRAGPGSASSAAGGPAGGGSSASSAASSSSPEVEVISTGSFVVDLGIDDTQIGRLAVGQQATVTPSTSTG
ncbi:MAG: biotin/lipoyl-binding protein, partial [Acidimicrobiales bacterium]